jgi:hypothetical protein
VAYPRDVRSSLVVAEEIGVLASTRGAKYYGEETAKDAKLFDGLFGRRRFV